VLLCFLSPIWHASALIYLAQIPTFPRCTRTRLFNPHVPSKSPTAVQPPPTAPPLTPPDFFDSSTQTCFVRSCRAFLDPSLSFLRTSFPCLASGVFLLSSFDLGMPPPAFPIKTFLPRRVHIVSPLFLKPPFLQHTLV